MPAVGCSRRSTQRAVVVLPHPDSPTSPSVSPRATAKLTPHTTKAGQTPRAPRQPDIVTTSHTGHDACPMHHPKNTGTRQRGYECRSTTDPHAAYGGGILCADGSVPEPPLADADTQAVAVAALRALGRLSGGDSWNDLADATSVLIAEAFDPQTMALDGGNGRVTGAGSQIGWLLWADAVPASYARRLVQADVLTDFGLRTLSSSHPQFAPDAYHRGAVWPFDSWLGWGGLRAAGFTEEAERVRTGVLHALERLGGAPELYAVIEDRPHRIPIANQVQAWTVGARWALENEWDGR